MGVILVPLIYYSFVFFFFFFWRKTIAILFIQMHIASHNSLCCQSMRSMVTYKSYTMKMYFPQTSSSPSNIILQNIETGKSSINVMSILIGNFWPIILLPVWADQLITLPFFFNWARLSSLLVITWYSNPN